MPCRLELGTPPEAVSPSGHRRHCLVPISPEQHVEMDKVRARTDYGAGKGCLFYMVSDLPKVKLTVIVLGPNPGAPGASKSTHNLGRGMGTRGRGGVGGTGLGAQKQR